MAMCSCRCSTRFPMLMLSFALVDEVSKSYFRMKQDAYPVKEGIDPLYLGDLATAYISMRRWQTLELSASERKSTLMAPHEFICNLLSVPKKLCLHRSLEILLEP